MRVTSCALKLPRRYHPLAQRNCGRRSPRRRGVRPTGGSYQDAWLQVGDVAAADEAYSTEGESDGGPDDVDPALRGFFSSIMESRPRVHMTSDMALRLLSSVLTTTKSPVQAVDELTSHERTAVKRGKSL